jgi:methyl-accepting chemotaxis protein
MGLGFLVALSLGVILSISITRPINSIIEGLSEGAEQVAAASEQVSSASHDLAEGAAQQAAAIEETSASLEEMSSMTKQNAQNSNHANTTMTETSRVVKEALVSMKELTVSMHEISSASEETQKIIKTIDEIAFQTNLLALNAAVEAARAGEAGAGFAVVADEVRSLALRSAESAKNTADLIEGTIKKVRSGSEIVLKASQTFERVAEGAKKAGELVEEMTGASGEQAIGIDQISRAVSEMDKVIQHNAATAEESASASEEMNAQAEQMKSFVIELASLVRGDGNDHKERVGSGMAAVMALPPRIKKYLPGKPKIRTSLVSNHRKILPDHLMLSEDNAGES